MMSCWYYTKHQTPIALDQGQSQQHQSSQALCDGLKALAYKAVTPKSQNAAARGKAAYYCNGV